MRVLTAVRMVLLMGVVGLGPVRSARATTYTLGIQPSTNATSGGVGTPLTRLQQLRFETLSLLALSDLHSGYVTVDPPWPQANYTLDAVVRTSYGTADGSVAAALEVLAAGACIVIGTTLPIEALPVADVTGAESVPLFSPSAAVSQLSDKSKYPYFTRGRNADIDAGPAILALAELMQWAKLCLVGSDEEYGQGMLGWMQVAAPAAGFAFYGSLFSSIFGPGTTASAASSFAFLIATYDCRVFVIHAPTTFAAYAIQAAQDLGLLDDPRYAFVGDTEWVSTVSAFPAATPLRGVLGVTVSLPTGARWAQWVERVTANLSLPELDYATVPLAPIEGAWYDAVILAATAISTLLLAGGPAAVTPSAIQAAIRDTQYVGVTGPFVFDANYDRVQTFDLINFQKNGALVYERLALWNATTGIFSWYPGRSPADFVWAGDATTVAWDGVSVLDGTPLPTQASGSARLLGFALCAVVWWLVPVLAEYLSASGTSVIRVRTAGGNHSSAPPDSVKGSSTAETSARASASATTSCLALLARRLSGATCDAGTAGKCAWTAAASALLGVAGAWAPATAVLLGNTWPAPVPLTVRLVPAALAAALSWAASFCALACAIEGHRANLDREDGSMSGADPDATDSASLASVKGAGSAASNTGDGRHGSGGAYAVVLETDTGKRSRALRPMQADRSIAGQVRGMFWRRNGWFAAGAVLQSGSALASALLLVASLPDAFCATGSAAPAIGYAAAATPGYLLALLVLFYFHPSTDVRALAAMVCSLLPLGQYLVVAATWSWTYCFVGVSAHGAKADAATFTLAACVVACMLVLVTFAANTTNMRLSRNALELLNARKNRTIRLLQLERECLIRALQCSRRCTSAVLAVTGTQPDHVALAAVAHLADADGSGSGSGGATETQVLVGGSRRLGALLYATEEGLALAASATETKGGASLTPAPLVFEEVIRDPVGFALLRRTAMHAQNSENLQFLAVLQMFRDLRSGEERKILAQHMNDQYFAEDATTRLNLTGLELSAIETRIRRGDCPETLFDAVATEVTNLVRRNDWITFQAKREAQLARAYFQNGLHATFAPADQSVVVTTASNKSPAKPIDSQTTRGSVAAVSDIVLSRRTQSTVAPNTTGAVVAQPQTAASQSRATAAASPQTALPSPDRTWVTLPPNVAPEVMRQLWIPTSFSSGLSKPG